MHQGGGGVGWGLARSDGEAPWRGTLDFHDFDFEPWALPLCARLCCRPALLPRARATERDRRGGVPNSNGRSRPRFGTRFGADSDPQSGRLGDPFGIHFGV